MLPAQRCQVGQQVIRNIFSLVAQHFDGAVQIDSVPEDNSRNDKVEAAGQMLLAFIGVISDSTEPMKTDGARERVAGLPFVEFGCCLSAEYGIVQPIEREQGPLDAPDFTKSQGNSSRRLAKGWKKSQPSGV